VTGGLAGRAVPSIGADRFTGEFLESLRGEGDGPADAAVATFFADLDAAGRGLYPLLVRTAGNDLDDEEAPGVAPFARAEEPWPDWADGTLVRRGQELFGEWGMQLSAGLFMASLPMTYACAKGAEPLVRTARLTSNPKRRFLETGQMIIDAMTPGALAPGGRGYRTVRHIRLMHAAVRHTLTHPQAIEVLGGPPMAPWDPALGLPLNQEDLLGCLLAFSVLGLRTLERAGISLRVGQAEAYVHAWSVVGHQIGIRADLLPLNHADAGVVAGRIFARQCAPSSAGRELAATAVAAMQDLLRSRRLMGLPASGIRYYLGAEVATLLAVPPADWTRSVFFAMRHGDAFASRALSWLPGRHSLSSMIGRRMVLGLLEAERAGGRPGFEITDELRQAWGLDVTRASAARGEGTVTS
jgi:ER-bound oxygenase mpaB/B'/Rubber oxygenase, catalytic domain